MIFCLSSSRAGERIAWTLLSFAPTDVKQQRNLKKKNIENIHIDSLIQYLEHGKIIISSL